MRSSEAEADGRRRLEVGIAEYEVTAGDALLTTSGLGSCVGVGLRDEAAGIAGLLHVMLPEANADADPGLAAKYADTGVEALLSAMEEAGADRSRLVAKVAGGSEMFDFSTVDGGVGERNVEAVREALRRASVPIVAEDVGSDHGRTLAFDPTTGDLHVRVTADEDRTI